MKVISVRNKISIGAGVCVLITALIIISFTVITMRGYMRGAAMNETVNMARGQAASIESRLNEALGTAYTLAHTLSAVKDDEVQLDVDRDKVLDILRIILEKNPMFTAVYTCWEPDGFDGMDAGYVDETGHDKTGRFAPYWQRDAVGKPELTTLLSIPTHAPNRSPGKWFDISKKTMKESILNPFEHNVLGQKVLITSLTAPIIANGRFYGVVGIDTRLDFLQTMADKLDIYENSGQMMIVGNNGLLGGITGKPELINKHIKEVHPEDYEKVLALIRKGEEMQGLIKGHYEIITPLKIGKTDTPWSVVVTVPKAKVLAVATALMLKMIVIGMICTAAALMLLWFIAGGIIGPISKVVDLANALAKGDLSQRLDMASQDEIGNMAAALDGSCNNLSDMVTQIKGNAGTLASSSEEMSTVSNQMASSAVEMSAQSDTVAGTTEQMSAGINSMASAAEEISVNIQSVSSTAEEMSQNMSSVAGSIEQMSTSIKDVAGSAREGADIAEKAREMSDSATGTMNILGTAAKEIGEVTNLIKRIAEQTNLLALNATIEAASAGDAGKGFAVVANEIKELANQSAQAAEDITKRIEGVQGNSVEAIKAIAGITDIINKINQSSVMITQSVEQQTAAATEISGSVQQADTGAKSIAASIAEVARGANDVSKIAAETAKGANEVSATIQAVSKAANDSNSGAQQVDASANELAKIAAQIQEMVGRFKVETA